MSADRNGHRVTARDATSDLVGGLVSDAKELVSIHGERIKLEVHTELGSLKDTIKLTGVAIAGAVLAGLMIGQAIAFGLSALTGLPLWASFGLVGVVFAIAGHAAFRKRPAAAAVDLVPEESMALVKRDLERLAEAVNS